jgi:hypothetical protein
LVDAAIIDLADDVPDAPAFVNGDHGNLSDHMRAFQPLVTISKEFVEAP